MVDTSTEAVTKLLDGVTPGPWEMSSGRVVAVKNTVADIRYKNGRTDGMFIAAARDLVPALLAERDALLRENENLRQIERNVQAVREYEYKRAEAALAEVERLKAQTSQAVKIKPMVWIDLIGRMKCESFTPLGRYAIAQDGAWIALWVNGARITGALPSIEAAKAAAQADYEARIMAALDVQEFPNVMGVAG